MKRAVHIHRIAGIGGSERHLLTLLPALREAGLETGFVGLDVSGDGPEPFYTELDVHGIPYVRLPATRDIDLSGALSLRRAVASLQPLLVHTHLVHADVYGGLAAASLGLPLFTTKHNDDPFRLGPFRHVERLLARRATRVIAITAALERFLVDRVGLPAGKVKVVRYGLDALPPAWAANPQLDLPDDTQVVLACARLVPQKGLDTLFRALPAIRAACPSAVVVVAGEGPEREQLTALARTLGVADAIHLPGRAGDVAALYRRAAVFALPSRWEGFGLVLLEAMLSGIPVVASNVSSVPEIVVDGQTGSLVPVDDPDALARATVELLLDPERARRMGDDGRKRALSTFSAGEMARRTLEVYDL